MSDRRLEDEAARQLVASGFLVIRGSRTRGQRAAVEADLVAWTGDDSGELVPELVVEIKANPRNQLDALGQLSQIAAITGAPRAFLFGGRWQEADSTFTHFFETDCPKARLPLSPLLVPTKLLEQEIWSIAKGVRERGQSVGGLEWVETVLSAAQNDGTVLSIFGQTQRARLAVARILSVGDQGEETPAKLASVMARLLGADGGSRVLDPFCRLGGLLWAVADGDQTIALQGWSPAESQIAIAHRLAAYAGAHVDLECSSIDEILAKNAVVDGLITILPFGARLPQRRNLTDGRATSELDVLMLDRFVRLLDRGGRAVIAVPPRLLFADSSAALRAQLAKDLRVVAVIELPGGVFRSTNLPIGIIVLERSAPGQTLVARLRDDWESQLAPSGDFFRAYEQHVARSQ